MSWSCTIITDKKIELNDVQDIIDNLPKKYIQISLISYGLKIRQVWGWATVCDVYNPHKNLLTIGGAYAISGDIAEEFVDYFSNELNKHNYQIVKVNWL